MNQKLLLLASERLLDALIEYFGGEEYIKPFRTEELANCVLAHAAAAGAASMAAGILPGAGAVIAVGVSAGAIWRMYIKICQIIGASFGKNKLRAISSAVLTNIVTQLAGMYAIQVASTFIPGAGIVVAGVGNFTVTYIAGLIFLNILTKLFQVKRCDIDNMSDDEIKASIKSAMDGIDKKAVMKEAKSLFMQMKKEGALDDALKTVDITMEEGEEVK